MFFCGWIIINLFYVGIKIYTDETFYGLTNLFDSFLFSLIVSGAIIISFSLIGASFIWLFITISKGLKKEKK